MAHKLFQPAEEPSTKLGYHRILSPTAAVKVSPLCLGAMNFGDAWKEFMGECNKEDTFSILDEFYQSGGNFIDTANNYQSEQSEAWLGEWMEKRGNRDEMVLATKFTTCYKAHSKGKHEHMSNYVGNSSKSLNLSLEASLKKLRTDYIDVLYVHWWDNTANIEELMQSLNRVVQAGKVLYLGISDTPAWIVSKANQYARDHGMRQFSVYQGLWSAAERDFERDILPMCEAEGMAMAPWGALGRGQFKTAEQRKSTEGRQMGDASENDLKVSEVLERIAKKRGTIMTSIALAYVMCASPYRVFPIVGGRKVEHLRGNIEALSIQLTTEEMEEIENATDWNFGFPMGFLNAGAHPSTRITAEDNFLTKSAARIDVPPKPSAVPEFGH